MMRKRLLFIGGFGLAVIALVSCTLSPTVPSMQSPKVTSIPQPPQPTEPVSQEPTGGAELTPKLPIAGEIIGDVLYKGIAVSLLFNASPDFILGEPLYRSDYEPIWFYDGLQVRYDGFFDGMDLENLSLFELNGVVLDLARKELVAAFGEPIEYYEYEDYTYRDAEDGRFVRYHVISGTDSYMLDFWFENATDKAYSCAVRLMGV